MSRTSCGSELVKRTQPLDEVWAFRMMALRALGVLAVSYPGYVRLNYEYSSDGVPRGILCSNLKRHNRLENMIGCELNLPLKKAGAQEVQTSNQGNEVELLLGAR